MTTHCHRCLAPADEGCTLDGCTQFACGTRRRGFRWQYSQRCTAVAAARALRRVHRLLCALRTLQLRFTPLGQLLVEGYRDDEIADALELEPDTVATLRSILTPRLKETR